MNLIRRLSLLMLVIAFTSGAFAQPVAQNASYDEMTNILTINFDSAIKTEADFVIVDGLIIDDDNGGLNSDYMIRGGVIVNSAATGTSLQLKPIFDGVVEEYTYTDPEGATEDRSIWGTDYADVRAIEATLGHDDMRIFLPDGFATSTSGDWTEGTWVTLTYVPTPSTEQVELLGVEFDDNSNVIRFEFNKKMQFDQVAEDIALRDEDHPTWFAPGNRELDNSRAEDRNRNETLEFEENVRLANILFKDAAESEFTPSVALDITRMDSTILELKLSSSYQYAMENMDLSTLTLSFDLFTFVDVDYNSVVPVTDMDVDIVNESNPLEVVSASYDIGFNKLTVNFDQPVDPNVNDYVVLAKFIVVVDDESDEGIALSRSDVGLANADSSVIFTLGVLDAQAVEEYMLAHSGSDFTVKVLKNAVLNPLINGNRVGEAAIEIIEETEANKGPEIDPAITPSYDAATNVLSVPFDLRIDLLIEPTGFYFVSGEDTLRLTGGVTSRSGGNRICDITLGSEDQQMLESYADKSSLRLNIDSYSVLQQSRLNGNLSIVGVEFDYLTDPNPPLVNYLWYDCLNNQMIVGSTTTISAANVDLTKLTIKGIAFSAADSLVNISTNQILCYINETDAAAFDALSDTSRINLVADIQAEFISNEDGVYNVEALGVTDKSEFSNDVDATTLLLGCGRPFYIKSREAFPTPTREIYASIRGISEHAFWYVSNDQWGPYENNQDFIAFTSAELDTVIEFFETSCIKKPTMGAYDVIMETLAGDQAERVPTKVDFLFADIYDEYKLGRNDTNSSFWEHGYFDLDDFPGSDTEYSNQDVVIIVDSYPQSFISTETAWFYDEDDEEWDEIPAGSNVTRGLPALANLYSRFVQYYVDQYEEAWIVEGLSYLSEFLVSGPAEFYGNGPTSGFSGGDILTFIGSIQDSRIDVIHAYMFLLYIWEKYGEDDVIREIATSPQVGMESIANVIASRQDELDSWVQGKAILDIYNDFAIANLLDISIDGDHGIYQFDNINIGNIVRGTQMKWKASPAKSRPPYSITDEEWSFNYNYTAYGPYDPNVLLTPETDMLMLSTSGVLEDARYTKLNVKALATDPSIGNTYLKQDIELDELGTGSAQMSAHNIDPDWIFGPRQVNDTTWVYNDDERFSTWIIVSVNGETGHSFKMTNDSGSSYYSGMYAVQNPVLKRKFDIHVVSEKPIYNTSGTESPMLTAEDAEGNTVHTLNTEDDFTTFRVEDQGVGFIQYSASVWMTEIGTYYWSLEGFYSNGLPVNNTSTMAMTYGQMNGDRNSSIKMGDEFALRTTSKALDHGQEIGIIRIDKNVSEKYTFIHLPDNNENLISVSPVYQILADQNELNDPATITLKYDVNLAGDEPVGIFMEYEGEWVNIGGIVDEETWTISTRTAKLGNVQIIAGDIGDVDSNFLLPSRYALNPNYPNPFNPSTTISMELPFTGHVSLVVYDVLGREVTRLVDETMTFGVHRVLWDGRSSSGAPLASGVYFAQMKAGGFNAIQKMVLVK